MVYEHDEYAWLIPWFYAWMFDICLMLMPCWCYHIVMWLLPWMRWDRCMLGLWYAMIDEWLGFRMIDVMLNMPLIGLRHKTQWEEANLMVGRFWVPNTFLRPYINYKHIPLVVKSIVLPWEDTIYILPRPLQKLGGDSPLCPR